MHLRRIHRIVRSAVFILLGSLLVLRCSEEAVSDAIMDKYLIQAGAAKIEVTPAVGDSLLMSGFSGRDQPFKGVHDGLFLKAVVLFDGLSYSAHFTSDQLTVSEEQTRSIALMLEDMDVPIPRSQLFMSATHTHGGISTSRGLHDVRTAYRRYRTLLMAEVIAEAYGNLAPVQLRMARMQVPGIHNNRQEIIPGDECDLGSDPNGVSDKTLYITRLMRLDGTPLASMLLFGVHATMMGQHNYYLTGDLPGAVTAHLEQLWGPDHISLWMMSGGGDQSPTFFHQKTEAFRDEIRSPKGLANQMVNEFLPSLVEIEQPLENIHFDATLLQLVLTRKSGSRDHRQIYFLEWNDETILVGTPFELFAQTVIDICEASPYKNTMVYSLTNGVAYYLPTPESWEREFTCYENKTSLFGRESEPQVKNTIINHLINLASREIR